MDLKSKNLSLTTSLDRERATTAALRDEAADLR